MLKGVVKNYNGTVIEKKFYDQPINSDKKRYKEKRKLTIRYTTGCLMDYEYIKNRYRLIAVEIDLSRQKGLDADSKAVQQIEFTRLYFSQESITVL